jgi:GTPase SAR1 family protein
MLVQKLMKIILVGDTGTGKTSIIRNFTEKSFEFVTSSTQGVDFKPKAFNIDGK